MSAGFTPGPWSILVDADNRFNLRITAPATPHVAKVYGYETADPKRDANAALIASAPELYEALAKATGMLRDYIMAVGVLADDGWVLAECDAALAKARGQ